MLPSDFLDGINRNVWSLLDEERIGPQVSNMLGATERKMLYWIANQFPLEGEEVLVDAGTFLGMSSLCMGRGLALNYQPDKAQRIHAYDMFRTPNDEYAQEMIGRRKVGTSFLDVYDTNTAEIRDYLAIYAGDICRLPAPEQWIGVLFVDVCKTRRVNASFNSRFFPRLVPGRSLILQQDYNDHACPWIKASMEHLRPYLRRLTDDTGTRVYLLESEIPREALAREAAGFDLATELDLLRRAADREESAISRFFIQVSTGWTIFEMHGLEAAIVHLRRLEQPWISDEEPYVERVIGSMQWNSTPDRLRKNLADYFEPAAI